MLVKAMANPVALTDAEAFQLSAVLRNAMLSFQDALTQQQSGLADDIVIRHAEVSLRFFLSVPAIRAMYRMFASTYAPELRAAVDPIIADTPTNPAIQIAAQLRIVLAEDLGRAAGGYL